MSNGEKARLIIEKMLLIADDHFSGMIEDNVLTIFNHLPIVERKELLVMCVHVWSAREAMTECPECNCVLDVAPSEDGHYPLDNHHVHREHGEEENSRGGEASEKKLTLSMMIGAAIVIIGTVFFVLGMWLSQPDHIVLEQGEKAKTVIEELMP